MRNNKVEYAMYKGDQFIDLGTIKYLSAKYGINEKYLEWSRTPVAHKRARRNTTICLYRIGDDDEDEKN